MLVSHPTLRTFEARRNKITARGGKAFLKALQGNNKLEMVELSDNKIAEDIREPAEQTLRTVLPSVTEA